MVHITCCFQCPSAVVENGKVTCVALWISFFFLNFQGEILHKHILFSCCQWKQKFLFKVSFWLNLGFFVFFFVRTVQKKMVGTASSVEWF